MLLLSIIKTTSHWISYEPYANTDTQWNNTFEISIKEQDSTYSETRKKEALINVRSIPSLDDYATIINPRPIVPIQINMCIPKCFSRLLKDFEEWRGSMNRMYLELNQKPGGYQRDDGTMAWLNNETMNGSDWGKKANVKSNRDPPRSQRDIQEQEAGCSLPPDYQFIAALINRP